MTLAFRNDESLKPYQLIRLANFMGWDGGVAKKGIKVVTGLAKAFIDDASLLEINPLVETTKGEIIAVDAKLSMDENALFRQQLIQIFMTLHNCRTMKLKPRRMI